MKNGAVELAKGGEKKYEDYEVEIRFDFGRELCKDLFKKWPNLDESHFTAEKVSGAITNLCICSENGNMVHVTVRLYGPNTECVINREMKLQALSHLSPTGFGPKLLGVFENGMV
ncbi:hypothetical protein L2E82_22937 [Cichorium intybus]|uniref:Uncharacterized protein n=1 Tax=Cichorium intybus TaxID=13427 RepID=A0ACB9DZC8_CICIN|nr:hypothetical protein L2E82_22937 [Cichorium intybus]